METDSMWFATLVIILSAFLAILLISLIVLVLKVLQIIRRIDKIVAQAESVADRAEHISEFFEKTATPVAIVKLLANISETIVKKAKK
jgi:hypothetical protein